MSENDQFDRLLLGRAHDLLSRMPGHDTEVRFEPGARSLTFELAELPAKMFARAFKGCFGFDVFRLLLNGSYLLRRCLSPDCCCS